MTRKPSWAALQGYEAPLEAEDIFDLGPDDQVETVSRDFEVHWGDEMKKPKGPSLVGYFWFVYAVLMLMVRRSKDRLALTHAVR